MTNWYYLLGFSINVLYLDLWLQFEKNKLTGIAYSPLRYSVSENTVRAVQIEFWCSFFNHFSSKHTLNIVKWQIEMKNWLSLANFDFPIIPKKGSACSWVKKFNSNDVIVATELASSRIPHFTAASSYATVCEKKCENGEFRCSGRLVNVVCGFSKVCKWTAFLLHTWLANTHHPVGYIHQYCCKLSVAVSQLKTFFLWQRITGRRRRTITPHKHEWCIVRQVWSNWCCININLLVKVCINCTKSRNRDRYSRALVSFSLKEFSTLQDFNDAIFLKMLRTALSCWKLSLYFYFCCHVVTFFRVERSFVR